ncbi:DUF427 domain-containing protein [Mesorhizobium sp. CC13]|uniref:DUF427 domain-containing protein n=1 Tax=Mesorhizobium sp. CC13 TaxID=3029194 RepID=UPI003265C611
MKQFKIVPFDGSVTVFFSDSVIASTTNAKALCVDGEPDAFYIPFEDIYFEFLTATENTAYRPGWGTAHFWRVSAVGQAAEDIMWAYVEPEVTSLANHGAFNPELARIEATPAERGAGSTRLAGAEFAAEAQPAGTQGPSLPTDDDLVRHLVETSDLSPLQAQDLVRRHGRDKARLDILAKSIKAES